MVVYLDDILVFSRSMKEHNQHVCLVLQRLLENKLYIKAEKCVFHTNSATYLGNMVETDARRPHQGQGGGRVATSH